ncbi:F-box/kelch-repeat protein At1g51550 [Diospyros lotus]|uniref:F-box/kelch-repeat protein At1g51550 n=1 Tax=Diospyros lotus TaxID=55363 RepID=UPI002257B83D|nr:F-box/kelch-repeat protein At1g51550 [Diospyros lotus]XP_052182490.1 F-box/kelch-repeat protein At1g51550 [Diospyros lotus]
MVSGEEKGREKKEHCPRNQSQKFRLQRSSSSSRFKYEKKYQTASMAESKSRSSNVDGSCWSPITTISRDHLFSILLLLPIDSILSFATTCKKFRCITYSDALWESICRRDWGQASVEAMKSAAAASRHSPHLPWMQLYRQVYQLDSVSSHRLSDPDADEVFPGPRASHSLNFVSGCLVMFGGGSEGGRHLDDTWVAHIGNEFTRRLKWQKINSGVPSGRFGHSCAVIGDSIVLFGGINDNGIRQNDTWIGQVLFHETFGITFSWRLLDVGSIAPPPRGAHAGCCIDNKRMIIHGGIGLLGVRLGDTWVLDLSENFLYGTWHEVVTHPSPPARSGHTLTCIGGNQTILFGGRGLGYEVLNDVWLFDSSEGEGCLRWLQLLFELRNIPGGLSLPRVGHSATLILGGRLLIYGGEDSDRHRKDDFWVLDISTVPHVKLQPVTLKRMGSLAHLWKRLKSRGCRPNCRSFHRACADQSGRYVYVFGGMVDGLIHPAELSGLRFDGELFLVELVLQC